jgi:hypothetical protein
VANPTAHRRDRVRRRELVAELDAQAVAKVEQEVDRLFELPLEEFIGARNELARLLKNDGNAAAAERVKQLSKPNVAVWTINQLSRQQKDAVRVLLDAATKLRKAQERALQSGGSRDTLRRAQAEEREAIRELTQQAQQILQAAGRPASSTVLNRIASTLRAAAVSEAGRSVLKAGRLTDEVTSSGFEALAGFEIPDQPKLRAAPNRDELAERRSQREELERKRRDLKERVRKLSARARGEERDAERAERAATDARTVAEKSRREAEEAAAELEELDQ